MTIHSKSLLPYSSKKFIYVETGTEHGFSVTLALNSGAKKAYSCDIDPDLVQEVAARLNGYGDKVKIVHASSPDFLSEVLPTLPKRKFLVVMLDAHDQFGTPLLTELQTIRDSKVVPNVLLIDDWRYIRVGYWGISEEDVFTIIKEIYGEKFKYDWEDGDGLNVDVLDGPAVKDVLRVEKI